MDVELTLRHFAENAPQFEIEVAHRCSEALARLARSPACDAVIIDLRMPDMSGLDFAREAQQRRLPLPPFIMISGKGDEATAIASLKLGAADYVTKRDGYLDQLRYAIERAIAHEELSRLSRQLRAELAERKRSESEREALEEQLRASQRLESWRAASRTTSTICFRSFCAARTTPSSEPRPTTRSGTSWWRCARLRSARRVSRDSYWPSAGSRCCSP
jgi:DNA-binding NtrC family response regulator